MTRRRLFTHKKRGAARAPAQPAAGGSKAALTTKAKAAAAPPPPTPEGAYQSTVLAVFSDKYALVRWNCPSDCDECSAMNIRCNSAWVILLSEVIGGVHKSAPRVVGPELERVCVKNAWEGVRWVVEDKGFTEMANKFKVAQRALGKHV